MSIIILLCILVIYIIAKSYDGCTKSTKIFTEKELNDMLGEMVGKSKAECRKIAKKYTKR